MLATRRLCILLYHCDMWRTDFRAGGVISERQLRVSMSMSTLHELRLSTCRSGDGRRFETRRLGALGEDTDSRTEASPVREEDTAGDLTMHCDTRQASAAMGPSFASKLHDSMRSHHGLLVRDWRICRRL
jgi:hypothetical protein